MKLCKITNLDIKLTDKYILKNVSTEIKKNITTVISGKNGSGKSTLLRTINDLIKPISGELVRNFNSPIPMLFQNPVLFDNTVKYNFEILSKIKNTKPNLSWYNKFNLKKIKYNSIKKISKGERQKLSLSRLMSFDQEVIFMDEPNQNLDIESDKKFIDLILEEKKNNKTIICILHDLKLAKYIADDFILLDNGKIVYDGSFNNYI